MSYITIYFLDSFTFEIKTSDMCFSINLKGFKLEPGFTNAYLF